jgi:hypothetical protein
VREFVRLRSCVRGGGILRKVKGKKKNGGFSAAVRSFNRCNISYNHYKFYQVSLLV